MSEGLMTPEEREQAREAMIEDGLYEPPKEFWEREGHNQPSPPIRGLGNFIINFFSAILGL